MRGQEQPQHPFRMAWALPPVVQARALGAQGSHNASQPVQQVSERHLAVQTAATMLAALMVRAGNLCHPTLPNPERGSEARTAATTGCATIEMTAALHAHAPVELSAWTASNSSLCILQQFVTFIIRHKAICTSPGYAQLQPSLPVCCLHRAAVATSANGEARD